MNESLKKKRRSNPRFIPVREVHNQMVKPDGKSVSAYAVKKWIKDGDLKIAIPPWDRRGKYVTENELRRFIKKHLTKEPEPEWPEDLLPYLE